MLVSSSEVFSQISSLSSSTMMFEQEIILRLWTTFSSVLPTWLRSVIGL